MCYIYIYIYIMCIHLYIYIYTHIHIYIYTHIIHIVGSQESNCSIRAALRATDPSLRIKLALGGAPTSCCPQNLPPRLRYPQCGAGAHESKDVM